VAIASNARRKKDCIMRPALIERRVT